MNFKLQLIDANILLEILMGRERSVQCQGALSEAGWENAISALTVHIVWYFAERYKLARREVGDLLAVMKVVPLDHSVLTIANDRYDGLDYEDCLQAACAEVAGCDRIISLDKHFAEHSGTSLMVLQP